MIVPIRTGPPPFPCTRCGACCRSVTFIPQLAHMAWPDGACRHLTADNLCSIYETRPKLCRVDATCPVGMPLEQWHAMNEVGCDRLHLRVYGTPRPR